MAYNPGDYNLPKYAVFAWIEGAELRVGFPSDGPNRLGHSIKITLDKCSIETNATGGPLTRQLGWRALLDILRQRERDHTQWKEFNKIGTAGSPVFSMIEEAIKSNGKKLYSEDGHQILTDKELEDLLG